MLNFNLQNKDYECPITQETMQDPVITPYGHSFERTAIEGWLNAGNNTCPITRGPLRASQLKPNLPLKQAIRSNGNSSSTSNSSNSKNSVNRAKPKAKKKMQKPLSSSKGSSLKFGSSNSFTPSFVSTRNNSRQNFTSSFRVTPELLRAREWFQKAQYNLQHDPNGTFKRLEERMRQNESNGVYKRLEERMRQNESNGVYKRMEDNINNDPNGTFKRLEERMRQNESNGVYKKMQQRLDFCTQGLNGFGSKKSNTQHNPLTKNPFGSSSINPFDNDFFKKNNDDDFFGGGFGTTFNF